MVPLLPMAQARAAKAWASCSQDRGSLGENLGNPFAVRLEDFLGQDAEDVSAEAQNYWILCCSPGLQVH